MDSDPKSSQFSGRLFTRLYFALVISIIVIGSSVEYFLDKSDETNHLNYVKDIHRPLFAQWNDQLLQSTPDQWPTILNSKYQNEKFTVMLFSLNDFAADKMTLEELSKGDLLALFDSDDALTLYQRIGLSNSVLSMEVFYGDSLNENSGWISVLFYFLIAGVVFLLIRPFANQLLQLKSAAVQFGRGHFSSRLELPANTTLAPIAEAFNTMTEKIEHLLLTQRDLVNSVSHELRTPLARLKFGFEVVESQTSERLTKDSIKDMKKDVNELELLIDEMLCYAEVNQIQTFSSSPVLIKNFINELVNQVHVANIRVTVKYGSSMTANEIIFCHEKSLNRALANVLRNALSFAESQCHILIFKSDQKIYIDINDDGPGLDGVDISRIFEPFYKQSNINRASGYGLGLAIAQTITKKQKGSLTVIKGSLKGACFRFVLPLPS